MKTLILPPIAIRTFDEFQKLSVHLVIDEHNEEKTYLQVNQREKTF